MKPEEMLKYATEYDIPERELNWLTSPHQKIKHVTKFRFPNKHLRRLSIEKSPFVYDGDNIWLLIDSYMYVYNYYTGKWIGRGQITDETSPNYHRSLKHAFDFAKRILKQDEEEYKKDVEMYNAGICNWCHYQVGKENLEYVAMLDDYLCKKCCDRL
ncbi:hypothetical protein [Methanosarcina mazei]|uniref:Uncharacterized protein n=1 Tax=Methanosarcina mazei TaxID=2209 RepID=A0A0F8H8J1_METMZ|nr:hypothetical protein [Methanosarcina mazei]KKG03919.1 hypothetical protein DU40_14385 [Methanosarcina mazei]KKG07683.1 hypothetical protein DU31_10475 [Methanosarcina mazei]KKG53925.1 hypothetical protein DU33_05220 [Methanosarcina mazei]KKG60081.1 hypothetical protein DU45_13205 [Methanosarcina mazei]KKG62677.1 hypothetical protein DU64_11230 [Methanosarcina mazei]